jgi:hypothetical protein
MTQTPTTQTHNTPQQLCRPRGFFIMPQSDETEVCVRGEWCANSLRHATAAAAAGVELLSRWMQPTDTTPAKRMPDGNQFFRPLFRSAGNLPIWL